MRTIQQIFDVLIARGHYKEGQHSYWHSPYMCNAARRGYDHGTITKAERDKVIRIIGIYIGDYSTLYTAQVYHQVQDRDFAARLKIYLNWAKRPKLRKDGHV